MWCLTHSAGPLQAYSQSQVVKVSLFACSPASHRTNMALSSSGPLTLKLGSQPHSRHCMAPLPSARLSLPVSHSNGGMKPQRAVQQNAGTRGLVHCSKCRGSAAAARQLMKS